MRQRGRERWWLCWKKIKFSVLRIFCPDVVLLLWLCGFCHPPHHNSYYKLSVLTRVLERTCWRISWLISLVNNWDLMTKFTFQPAHSLARHVLNPPRRRRVSLYYLFLLCFCIHQHHTNYQTSSTAFHQSFNIYVHPPECHLLSIVISCH